MPVQDWHDALLDWFDRTKRDLPWRRTSSPYAIWVSEIMLQQTQVATVIPYYERWMEAFPTVEALATADEQEVLAHWAGLGYYRRARLLHAGAKMVAERGWPQNRKEWLDVPGVGMYTAGAIASIAQGEAVGLVDGNVERVFSRLLNVHEIGPTLLTMAWAWAERNVVPQCPGDWNQALMELGATICTPKKPKCLICPIQSACKALAAGTFEQLPVAAAKPIKKQLAFWVQARADESGAELSQIPPGAWWEGMWEFERSVWSEDEPPHHDFIIRHVVTHHKITLYVQQQPIRDPSRMQTWEAIDRLPLPAPQRKIVQRIRKELR